MEKLAAEMIRRSHIDAQRGLYAESRCWEQAAQMLQSNEFYLALPTLRKIVGRALNDDLLRELAVTPEELQRLHDLLVDESEVAQT
jgi:hypothetical protein